MSISINSFCVCITYVINFHVKYLITTDPSVPVEGAVASALQLLLQGALRLVRRTCRHQAERSPGEESTMQGLMVRGGRLFPVLQEPRNVIQGEQSWAWAGRTPVPGC